MMSSRIICGVLSLIAVTLVAQEPRGWKQPMLQPTIPPKVVEGGSMPVWKVPLVHPTIPPTIAAQPVLKQHYNLFVPHQGTNGLGMTVTNVVVIVPGMTNQFDLRTTNLFIVPFDQGFAGGGVLPSYQEYVRHWEPELMYPTYPPKLAPLPSLGLLDRH